MGMSILAREDSVGQMGTSRMPITGVSVLSRPVPSRGESQAPEALP